MLITEERQYSSAVEKDKELIIRSLKKELKKQRSSNLTTNIISFISGIICGFCFNRAVSSQYIWFLYGT